MRLRKLYVTIAPLIVALATTACQSGKKPVSALPAQQAAPPAIAETAAPTSVPQQSNPAAPAPVPEITATPGPSADPAADLIAKVEKEYTAGQENYKAGHLEAARQNFDRAFDMLLGSELQINSDPRLEAEFDRILEGTNGFEMQALQQGDGFTEQKSEPAPIDQANDVTYPVDANIKAKAEAEIKSTHSDLPLMMTDQVASYINYFSSR